MQKISFFINAKCNTLLIAYYSLTIFRIIRKSSFWILTLSIWHCILLTFSFKVVVSLKRLPTDFFFSFWANVREIRLTRCTNFLKDSHEAVSKDFTIFYSFLRESVEYSFFTRQLIDDSFICLRKIDYTDIFGGRICVEIEEFWITSKIPVWKNLLFVISFCDTSNVLMLISLYKYESHASYRIETCYSGV